MRSARDELQGEIEMVSDRSDRVENIHRGLVNMDGGSQFRALHANGDQSFFAMEIERTWLLLEPWECSHECSALAKQWSGSIEGDTTDIR